uniref:BZIP domain-containing protein n=1 Tax=Leptocylindrus danicus TaxID=163516 RepID=A0A7S2LA46_9STRA|mmetsp:Transcript_33990/g.49255  ORF Transcript_33990/g.49255 Transcript_33990/m.49255 type:complete len:197 (+) Transcript_33990:217-807(+)|eukprot:CAMPEP_0116032596 /NCGR_PEP_ID=MMETSP0321-20121206/18267_1 /TAXON_ID=163516 /ORGANISM="Leptocylindrus danicus var. danicus, Strain B650" /LENGTH=196 /DNA_ID=CAMNT_0003508069 /DNA_START=198 /DNA_END=788 /DNA_ORIENTATION=+
MTPATVPSSAANTEAENTTTTTTTTTIDHNGSESEGSPVPVVVVAESTLETEQVEDSKKRKTRLEQNRISARESRKRKKMMIEELQRSVAVLSNENRLLNQQNQLLRHQLVTLVPGASLLGLPGMQMQQAVNSTAGIPSAHDTTVPGFSDVAALQNLWQATNSAANLTTAAANVQSSAQVVNIPPAPATATNGSDS